MSHLCWYPGHELLLPGIVRASGCSLFDSTGRRWVDLESGVWCTPLGHGHPRVLDAMVRQAERIGHTGFCYSSPVVEQAAEAVLAVSGVGGGGRCVFLCSGSEAVEYSVRVAQAVIDRPLLLTTTDAYCGAYGSASSKREDEWYCFDWSACTGCPDGVACDRRCSSWAAIPFDRIGGFLLEPGSSSGLVRFPPVKLVRALERAMREADGLVLVNEVTTGVGRTARWFGHEHYQVTPDIVAIGKGIGNGYPVSVAALGPRVVDRLGGEPIHYAQSHQNDPLGAAVATAVVRTIDDEGLLSRAESLAVMLGDGLDAVRIRTGRIAQIRARGLMAAIELVDDGRGPDAGEVHRELVRRGYVLARRPGLPVLRLDPALTLEREDLDGFLDALEAVLNNGR